MTNFAGLKLTITVGLTESDYTNYVEWESIHISEKINVPSQCTFLLKPINAGFRVPPQRGYVRIYSPKYDKSLFTGYINSEPVRSFQSLASFVLPDEQPLGVPPQLFFYTITCTSDEVLLNMKAIPFIPAFVNRTQGQILTDLAETLTPGFFDSSMIASGDIVPYHKYDPKQSWSEVAKKFGDGVRFRYKVRDKQITYQPYGDQPLGISYDEQKPSNTFDARALNTTVLTVPIVNDVTIVGDVEAGNNRDDYVIGDGFTGNFPLHHKVFRGAATMLLQETWANAALNQQQWYLQDPGTNFDFSAGALNLITPLSGAFAEQGQSYLAMNNGLELAGGINIENGEFTFNDVCEGIIGGLYSDSTFVSGGFLGGFQVSSPSGIVFPGPLVLPNGQTTTGIGVSGVHIQPVWAGKSVGPPVISKPNHNYILQMVVTAPKYTRYNRIYRTIEGEQYGGVSNQVFGNVTWNILDYDIIAASGFYYIPEINRASIANVEMPAFCVYVLINNGQLNLTDTNTTIASMPMGSLQALVGPCGLYTPTGLILPMLPESSGRFMDAPSLAGGYVGGVQPWAAAASANILPLPGILGTDPAASGSKGVEQEVLGNGFVLQAAQITQGNDADVLAFYAQTLPAAGTPVRLQTWEAQAAVSRLQDFRSIVREAFVVGDDGIRSAIVTDLNPLPRTSEDCDNAAQAFLKDRIGVFYNGTYTCTSYFFQGLSLDQQFWPTCGRFLNINSPRRGITGQKYLVTGLNMTVLDAQSEIIQFDIQFGADTYLEKFLKTFVAPSTPDVLSPKDLANPPNPRWAQQVDNSFLPDLNDLQVDLTGITPTSARVAVFLYWATIEIRQRDTNWGIKDTFDFVGFGQGPNFQLVRTQYDQTWFMRAVLYGIEYTDLVIGGTDVQVTSAANPFTAQQAGRILIIPRDVPGFVAGKYLITEVRLDASAVLDRHVGAIGTTHGRGNIDTMTSRRSKVIRIRWPLQPAIPLFVYSSPLSAIGPGGQLILAQSFQLNFNGDMRNIYGFEVRAADNTTILVQKPIASYADLYVDLSQTPLPFLPAPLSTDLNLFAYFFNHQWAYSPALLMGPLFGELSPGKCPFLVVRIGYAMLSIENLEVTNNEGVGLIKEMNFLAPSIDETDIELYGTGSIDATTDPVTFTATFHNGSRFVTSVAPSGTLFEKGNYIVWNDETVSPVGGLSPSGKYQYECDMITDIVGNSVTLQRNPGLLSSQVGEAQFGSWMTAHANKRFYRLVPKMFSQAIKPDTFGTEAPVTPSGLPRMWEFPWANKCVVAVVSQAIGESGYGQLHTLNLAPPVATTGENFPPAPGFRTMNGAAYMNLGKTGDLTVGDTAEFRAKVQAWESVRVPYGYMQTAPVGTETASPDLSLYYGYAKTITIDHTKFASTQTSFPVLVKATISELKTVANGGHVTSSVGDDIIFADGTNLDTANWLNFERVSYDPTTGAIVFWVQIPSCSSTVDTVIYMLYGNSSTTSYQGWDAGTWLSGYKLVSHLESGTAPINSSTGSNNLASHGSANATVVTGQVGSGLDLTPSDSYYYTAVPSGLSVGTNPRTIEAWIKPTTSGGVQEIFGYGTGTDATFSLRWDQTTNHLAVNVGGEVAGPVSFTPDGNWHYFVAVLPVGGTKVSDILIYLDGALQTNSGSANVLNTVMSEITIGVTAVAHASRYIGAVDEVRISNVARSAAWIVATYDNVAAPPAFYTVGSEVILPAAPTGTFETPYGNIIAAAAVVYVLYIEPIRSGGTEDDRKVCLVDMVVWQDGWKNSYDPLDGPDGRQMPYYRHWPPNWVDVVGTQSTYDLPLTFTGEKLMMEPDGELDFIVALLGNTTAGSNLIIVLQT